MWARRWSLVGAVDHLVVAPSLTGGKFYEAPPSLSGNTGLYKLMFMLFFIF